MVEKKTESAEKKGLDSQGERENVLGKRDETSEKGGRVYFDKNVIGLEG
jgi:hypothetical protein